MAWSSARVRPFRIHRSPPGVFYLDSNRSLEDSDVGIVDNFGDGTVQDLLYLKYLPLVSQEHPDSDGLAVFNPTESVESVVRTLKW